MSEGCNHPQRSDDLRASEGSCTDAPKDEGGAEVIAAAAHLGRTPRG